MYHYVQDKDFLRRAQSDSSRMLKRVEELLRKEYKINSQIFLVGSGAKNMVTQNENESIDFDYNLNIISCPDWEDPGSIKESVRKAMNRIMTNEGLGTVDDSTSCLTTKTINFKDSPENKWSIDLCVVTKDSGGNWQRLIHEKRDSPNMIGIFGILPQIQKTIHIKQRKSRNVLDGGTKSETAI